MQNTEIRKPIEALAAGAQTNRGKQEKILKQQLREIEASLKTTHDEDKFRQEVIAGCEVDIPCGKDELQAAERKNSATQDTLQTEAREAQIFADKVRNTTGYTPIAVIPAELWQNFCNQCDLWRFENLDSESKIFSNYKWEGHLKGSRLLAGGLTIAALVIAAIAFFCSIGETPPYSLIKWLLVTAGISLVLWLTCKITANFMKMTPKRFRLALCEVWPYRVDAERMTNQQQWRWQVRFPNPPQNFAQKLRILKQCNLHPCVAATPDAISVEFAEGQKLAAQLPTGDPILFIKNPIAENTPRLVAVLDHFGNFPDEQEAVRLAWECSEQYYAKL